MSDEFETTDGQTQADESFKTFQEDFKKTTQQQSSSISELVSTQKQLIDALNTLATPQASQSSNSSISEEDIQDLLISNPKLAVEKMTSKIKAELETDLNAKASKQNESNQVLMSLEKEFPELRDAGHPLTAAALQIYDKMDSRDKSSPMAYKVAVTEAALEVGIKPKSRRTSNDDTFQLQSRSEPRTTQKPKASAELLSFAKKMGLNTSDPKLVERLGTMAATDVSKYMDVL